MYYLDDLDSFPLLAQITPLNKWKVSEKNKTLNFNNTNEFITNPFQKV